ncbi:UPAR/Ly6 domain-containing protein qvr-like [Tubulanus polymorphus]|uniref:UPAR/Ly6 domain-containing protein qvr-like n=1 Tax=Tubulanus polymorphus TaxID=672921 RepID=UPI003DA3D3FC
MGSPLYGIPIDTSLYITVVLITSALCFGDDECLTLRRIKCYECTSKTHKFCGDPFNASHPDAHNTLKNCDAACVKWVRMEQGKTKPSEIRRTCTTRVPMTLHADLVCMSESSSGIGHICFCNTKKCNSAPSGNVSNVFLVLTMATMATIVATVYWTRTLQPEYICGLVASLFALFGNVVRFKDKLASVFDTSGTEWDNLPSDGVNDYSENVGQTFTDVACDSIKRYAIRKCRVK